MGIMMQLVTNILLASLVIMLAAGGAVAYLIYRRFTRTIAQFLTPEAEGKPSPLALAVDAAAVMVGRSVAAQVKTLLMGIQSGDVRAEKAVQGALAMDAAEGAGLGGLLSASPNLRRTLRRNPSLIDIALPLVSNLFGKRGSGVASSDNGASGPSPRFRL